MGSLPQEADRGEPSGLSATEGTLTFHSCDKTSHVVDVEAAVGFGMVVVLTVVLLVSVVRHQNSCVGLCCHLLDKLFTALNRLKLDPSERTAVVLFTAAARPGPKI